MWFILLFIIVVGLFVISSIQKESAPEITIPIVGVSTAYPGASSAEVEELITNPIEDALIRGLNDVENITSTSQEGFSSITIEFNDSIDVQEAVRSVQDEVARVENELPSDARDPVTQEFSFEDQPVFVVSLSSREAYTQLSDTADIVDDILSNIRGVLRVEVSGIPERQVTVIINTDTLAQYELNITDIERAIAQTDVSVPVGSIVQDGIEYNIGIDTSVDTVEDLNNLIIGTRGTGSPLYLGDVARIDTGLAAYTSLSRLSVNGSLPQQAITFSVYKQVGFDITTVTEDIREALDELQQTTPGMQFVTLIDMGEYVAKDIANLSQSALLTIILVVTVLSLALGVRESIIAGISVPISFLLAFIGLYLSGNTINFISLFALILSIGLLVDASIVIIEGISTYREKGIGADEAIRATLREFASPVTSGMLTTVVVFIPLAFLSGITGQFIRSIPLTIIFVLISSLIVALVFVPLISTVRIRRFEAMKDTGIFKKLTFLREKKFSQLTTWYQRILSYLLEKKERGKRFIRGLILLFVISLSLVATGLIKSEFFPMDNFDQVSISMSFPEGTQLTYASERVTELEDYLKQHEHVESFVSQIQPTSASITVILTSDLYGEEAVADFRAFASQDTSRADIVVTPPAMGPSVGAPFSVNITGDNYDVVTQVAADMKELVARIPGTTQVESDAQSSSLRFSLNLNLQKVRDLGLDVGTIARIVRTNIFGSEVATISKNGDDVDVILIGALNKNYTKVGTTNHVSFDTIRSIPLQLPGGGSVPLGVLMEEELQASTPSINHKEGERVVTVSSYLQEGVVLSDVLTVFTPKVSSLDNIEKVEWSFGGDAQESAESGKELMIALFIGILLVLGVLMFQFNSVRNTMFIFSVVPLGLIGVLWGLFIFQESLSFTSMLGFVALVGIIVNNSIILIDVLSHTESSEMDTRERVIVGSTSRLRPILLTTTTTVIGMSPLLFTSPVWRPLALTIITGLTFAVLLTLFLIPLLYYRHQIKKEA